jgi:nucleotidyltransferase/DNA polymerase involved in DNA repair
LKFNISRKLFAHIDCDSFFAECEIYKNPKLKNKYVLVWNEIVIACNYKTKALWIKTWTPVWEAKKILQNKWVFLEWDHRYYNLISDKLMTYLEKNTLSIEPFSIDEAFCEITWLAEMNKLSLENYIKKLQKNILKEVWVPVSIWVSNTRIKAKIFSKLNKPFWIYISLTKEQDKEIFLKLPLSIVPYIWKKTGEKFKYTCNNIYDFIKLWYWKLKEKIWKNATDLWLELSWVNAFIVKKSKSIKSMSRWRSFNHNITNDKAFLKEQLILNFNWLYEEFIIKDLELKCISIFFRDKLLNTHIYNHIFLEHTYIRSIILENILVLFEENFDNNILYRSTWIVFSSFRSYKPYQTSIFDKPLRDKKNHLQLVKTVNRINLKYWTHKLWYWTELLWESPWIKLGIRK